MIIEGTLNTDPVICTEHFLNLIENLSPGDDALWHSCTSRIFDYGFDGGPEDNPIHIEINAAHLARMAKLGIDFRITVYPYRAAEPEDDYGSDENE